VDFRDHGVSNLTTAILKTRDGVLLAAGMGLSAHRNGQWRSYAGHPELPLRGQRKRLLETSDGALWVASLGGEPARLDFATSRWTSFKDLSYRCDTPDGSRWFLLPDGGVVREGGGRWTLYDTDDGLMDFTSALIADDDGNLWAGGNDDDTAATSRFDGIRWTTTTHPRLSWGIERRAAYKASDGSLWFGAGVDSWQLPERGYQGGVIHYVDGKWTHQPSPAAPRVSYGFGESADGILWSGSLGRAHRYDGTTWETVAEPSELSADFSDVVYSAAGHLWMGMRTYGLLQYDGESWVRHDVRSGLAGNRIYGITHVAENDLLVLTDDGFSRFDGESWTTPGFPAIPNALDLRSSDNGSIWVNTGSGTLGNRFLGGIPGFTASMSSFSLSTVRYLPESDPPDTEVTHYLSEVSQPGNATVTWSGSDPWKSTPEEHLEFAYRMDSGAWSSYTKETSHLFEVLPSGDHTFEVRARDRDFNVDQTPATVQFTVIPPVWQQGWFIGMIIVFVGGIGFQTSRVVRRDRRLRESNQALSNANNELFQVNVDLQREQVLERLRGQAQGMQSSEDIKPVAEAVYRELSGLGLPLMGISIGIHLSDTATEVWITGEDGRALEPFVVENALVEIREAQRSGDDYYYKHLEGEEIKEQYRRMAEQGNPRAVDVPEEQMPSKGEAYAVFFEGGRIMMPSEEPIAEEYLMLIKRFGEVFGYAHSRHKELQEKETQNRRLAVEASVQRLRAEVQSMDEASDFERILSLLTESLKTVELTFAGCEIDVLDEPVENPTMAHFEANGFRYTTYTLDPDGRVGSESFPVPAPFPGIVRETIERFIESEPWFGTSQGKAIVEVPAGSYGRLRLTTMDRDSFTDDEVATLREFADAVALGYARYLDIREIQLNTERKSEFLASMSHGLRTPMNAIKGFTNLVLGRRSENLNDQQRENLGKVSQASDHLLGMINDLLDLSKIEAGRMDVNPERFDVRELVTSACDTVSPLIQEGVELRQDVADDIGEANTDKARVQQMVINLLSNAIKFTESGSVVVTAQREEAEVSREKESLASASSVDTADCRLPTRC
jgi:hypothetical protein